MNRKLFLISLAVLLFSCNKKEKGLADITDIYIQVENVAEELDISSLFEDSVDVVPLETTDDCLLSDIQKIEYKNQLIYLSDEVGQKVYVFDKNGRFIRSIGTRGNGPDEYSELGDFIVVGDSIYIQDKFKNKILIYDDKGNCVHHIDLQDIPYVQFTNVGNRIYFLVNYEKSKFGHYNMVAFDLKTQEYQAYLPYDEYVPLAWGLNNYISNYKETALFILARDNSIYEIANDTLSPKYRVSFSKNNLPSYIAKKDGGEVLKAVMEKRYITGINNIINSKDYLFLSYFIGSEHIEVLFDITKGENTICRRFIIKDMGNFYVNQFQTTDNDEFIIIQDANMFTTAWEKIYKNNFFKNKEVKNRLNEVFERIAEDSNPVFFKLKLKQ